MPVAPLALPEKLDTLKVPELKEQLICRDKKPAGRKADLVALLQKSVASADALLAPEDMALEVVRTFYGALARAAPASAPKERWCTLPAVERERPVQQPCCVGRGCGAAPLPTPRRISTWPRARSAKPLLASSVAATACCRAALGCSSCSWAAGDARPKRCAADARPRARSGRGALCAEVLVPGIT